METSVWSHHQTRTENILSKAASRKGNVLAPSRPSPNSPSLETFLGTPVLQGSPPSVPIKSSGTQHMEFPSAVFSHLLPSDRSALPHNLRETPTWVHERKKTTGVQSYSMHPFIQQSTTAGWQAVFQNWQINKKEHLLVGEKKANFLWRV